jgi:hypothetical protein
MGIRRTGVLLGLILGTLALASAGRTEILGDYVSGTACMECHAEIVEGWKTTPHARAFETLKNQGEEKLKNPGCVKCHVVGFDKDGGFIDMDLTPELKGVQCECCHGPGRRHAESQDPADIVGKPGEAVCRACHTEGQDKNFDFGKKSLFIHGKK